VIDVRGRLLVTALALLLAGCVMSLQELRQQPPARTAVVANRQYDALAGCVVDGLQLAPTGTFQMSTSDMTYAINRRPELGIMTVTAVEPNYGAGPSVVPHLDLRFIQQGEDVLVESRLGDIAGGEGGTPRSRNLSNQAWTIIEQCVRK
jgi:hypothetical protein